jgi:hypothetical protein
MAADKEEFLELVSHESAIDMDRLRDISFYGIPVDIRGKIWLVLLPRLSPSLSALEADGAAGKSWHKGALSPPGGDPAGGRGEDPGGPVSSSKASKGAGTHNGAPITTPTSGATTTTTTARATAATAGSGAAGEEGSPARPGDGEVAPFSLGLDDQDNLTDFEILRVLKTELARYQRRNTACKTAKTENKILNILYGYLHNAQGAWHVHHAALVHVVAPFAVLLKKESEASYCFQLMMRALDTHFSAANGLPTLGRFLMLFRSRLPELFTHFEEEDLEAGQWASPWLQWLLCRELPFECCLRLWDSYFSAPDGHGFELHTFVCLAILDNCQTDLIELEHAELLAFLRHLPSLDIDRIVTQAQYLAHDFRFQ